jgi:hypothetical protein
MRKGRPFITVAPLPPRLPQNIEELERTLNLLGNRKKNELNVRARASLEALVGCTQRWPGVVMEACFASGLSESEVRTDDS